ncbi:MAG: VOC family protein [Elusimicrobia bacterium]|nr:VOC family protein [Elusimicrobiota bacterium]
MKDNVVVWFDIPVKKLERAMKFYGRVLGLEIKEVPGAPKRTAFFPHAPGTASGCLVEGGVPSRDGSMIYLSGGKDLSGPLSRIAPAGGGGGKVNLAKTPIGEHGFIAHFEDTEGNRVALHSVA